MRLMLIIFLLLLLALLGTTIFFAGLSRILILTAIGVLLTGGTTLIFFQTRNGESKLLQIVRLYLQRAEQIHGDFATRKALEKQAADLTSFLFNDLELGTVALFARRKQWFLLIAAYGIKKEQLKSVRFGARDTLIQTIESRRSLVSLSKLYVSQKSGSPVSEFSFEEALPILSAGKCSHFILFSDSGALPIKPLRPFLLALADQLGNYSHLEDQQHKHNQLMLKLRKQLESMKHEQDRIRTTPRYDSRAAIAAQDRLLRIRNRDQLYATLIQLIEEQYSIDFVLVFVFNSDKAGYEVKYQNEHPRAVAGNFELPADAPLFSELRLAPRCLRIDKLAESSTDQSPIHSLKMAGASALALLANADGSESLLVVGRAKSDFSDEELDAVFSHCRLFNLVLENLNHYEQIEQMSYTDSMTGLYNYRYFYKRLQEEMLRAQRFSRQLALVIFDIDEFKVFNDTYGHQSGDFLLEQLGGLLTRSVRSIDVVSRYGGEEFCVIMPETSSEDCMYFMDRMRVTALNQEFEDKFSEDHHRITVSLGGAIYPNDAQRIDRLIYCADMALLQAKNSGKNRSFMFDEKLLSMKK